MGTSFMEAWRRQLHEAQGGDSLALVRLLGVWAPEVLTEFTAVALPQYFFSSSMTCHSCQICSEVIPYHICHRTKNEVLWLGFGEPVALPRPSSVGCVVHSHSIPTQSRCSLLASQHVLSTCVHTASCSRRKLCVNDILALGHPLVSTGSSYWEAQEMIKGSEESRIRAFTFSFWVHEGWLRLWIKCHYSLQGRFCMFLFHFVLQEILPMHTIEI